MLEQPDPCVAVARVVLVEALRGLLDVAVEHRRALGVGTQQVGHDGRRVHPVEPVLLELEPGQHGDAAASG